MNARNGYARFILSLFALGAVVFFSSASFYSSGETRKHFELARVDYRDLSITVNTMGILDTARSHMVSSAIKGNMGKIISLVDDGTWVEKDDVLVRFDPTPFELEILSLMGQMRIQESVIEETEQAIKWEANQQERKFKIARFELKASRLELKQLIEGDGPMNLAQLESEVGEAEEEFLRYKNFVVELSGLEKKGFSNPAEIKSARKKSLKLERLFDINKKKLESYRSSILPSMIKKAENRVEKMIMELDQTKKGSAIQKAKGWATLEKARLKLLSTEEKLYQVQRELGKTVIKAPFPGIVVLFEAFRDGKKRKPRVGDVVFQNQPVLYLPDISSYIVKTKVREVDLYKIQKNQVVNIRTDAYPSLIFKGRVLSIGAMAERSEGLGRENYFKVVVSLDGTDSRLRPGMTGRVSILSKKAPKALSVPLHSVFVKGSTRICYKFNGVGFERVPVTVGLSSSFFSEITSGLRPGDQVSLIDPDNRK